MKRKTYEKKMRNLMFQLNKKMPSEKRVRDVRAVRPDFGYVPEIGKFEGVPLESYQQFWDYIVDLLKGIVNL